MSTFSAADTLARLAPQMGSAGLPAAGLTVVMQAAARVPAALGNSVYLEHWMQGDARRLDLIVHVEPGRQDVLDQLARAEEARAPGGLGWPRVREFARAWGAGSGALHELVAGAWIEFDLGPEATAGGRPVEPRVFVDFVRARLPELAPRQRRELVRNVLAPLRGDALAAHEAACLDALPPGGTLPYVGVDVRVASPGLRLCLRGLGERVPEYLRNVGWPGDVDDLVEQVLAPMARAQGGPPGGTTLLHVDVEREGGIAPRVGLEYAFARLCQVQGRLAEDDLLELLVRRGWCDAHTIAGLRAWPGQSIELLPHQIWHSRVGRRVNHVKLTYATGRPVSLKTYFCIYQELLADGTLVGSRPRHFGALPRFDAPGSRAPNNGASAPTAPTAGVATPAEPVVMHVDVAGTRIAYVRRRGGHAMTMTAKEQHVLEAVLQRSVVDLEFRRQLLHDPRRAMQEALGVSVPANFRVKFIEKDKNVDALVVLPNYQCPEGELSEDELETVAGGGGRRPPTDPDWGEVP